MKTDNKFRLAVFGLYPNAKAYAYYTIRQVIGVDYGDQYVTTEGEGFPYHNINIQDCQLILKDLSRISEEDAIVVIKNIDCKEDGVELTHFKWGWQVLSDYGLLLEYVFDNKEIELRGVLQDPEFILSVFDSFRQNNFHLPYLGKDLIKEGIAVYEHEPKEKVK